MPWKNGGGETVEIAVSPSDASVSSFDWRISMARVVVAGPFSAFEGIDRSLVVLIGQGMRLTGGAGAGNVETVLRPDSEPCVFSGDIPIFAELVDGLPVTDFNVMTRRSRYRHHLEKKNVVKATRVSGEVVILYCISGQFICRNQEEPDISVCVSSGQALAADSTIAGKYSQAALQIESADGEQCQVLAVQIYSNDTPNG